MREYQPPPGESERHRRQDQMAERAIAAQRKPAEQIGEEVEKAEAQHELRRRHGEEGERHRHLVAGLAAPRRRIEPGRNADQELGDDRSQHQQQGGGKPGGDERADFTFSCIGNAEVALRQPLGVGGILLDEGLVEAELDADLLAQLRRRIAPGDHRHRIGRDEEGEAEGDDRHAHQDEGRGREPLGEIEEHQRRPRCVGSSASRRPSPARLKASATIRMAAPGMKTSHGALRK